MEIETPCTCGHPASSHNVMGQCKAPLDRVGSCTCMDFTTDDVALASAVGVMSRTSNLQTLRDAIDVLKLRTPIDTLALDRLVMTLQDHEHETCLAADPSQCTGLQVARDVLAGRR